jgi:non-lysosomal glucosylceramidase
VNAESQRPSDRHKHAQHPDRNDCQDSCCSDMNRRQFIGLGGAAVLSTTVAGSRPAMAGPFATNEYLQTIPIDKKLNEAWVQSLFERGAKQTYQDHASLSRVGMPVGGLFAGTVYLSGDGRLWLWDVFNRDQNGILPRDGTFPSMAGAGGNNNMRGLNYLHPAPLTQPFEIGFSLRVKDEAFPLDSHGFKQVQFDGRYPMGRVTYQDKDCPVEVHLEAFSPFIPLDAEDSSLPATIMAFRLKNNGTETVDVAISGQLQNAVCLETKSMMLGQLRNQVVPSDKYSALLCSAEPPNREAQVEIRPDILFDDFERIDHGTWSSDGKAFGAGPVEKNDVPDYQGELGGQGQYVVNSHAAAPGNDVAAKDGQTGTLTSRSFKIERHFIRFLIGGGANPEKTCVNLMVDDQVVATATGRNDNRMFTAVFNTRRLEGQEARLQVVDRSSQGWGNIGLDQIVFTDQPLDGAALDQQRDFGTMALGILGTPGDGDFCTAKMSAPEASREAVVDLSDQLIGQLGRRVSIKPGAEQEIAFLITWHFPNFHARGVGSSMVGHFYASRFESALDVLEYVAQHYDRLAGTTRTWVSTWYDSTLPTWLLDRTMANTSTLATTTCYRFRDGRFWAWEGVGCCQGTCTHVWHYAQAPGRLFPEIERLERERVNFGIGQHADGGIGMRTDLKASNEHADDGHCGRVLGVLREHQMSANHDFLRRLMAPGEEGDRIYDCQGWR